MMDLEIEIQEDFTGVNSLERRSNKSKLIKYKQKLKKNKKMFPCDHCKKILSSFIHLQKHLNTTHKPKEFICDYEGKCFNTKDKLRLHILQHRLYYRVSCNICQKEYKTNQSMRKHLRTHFEQHQCEACGQTFRYKRLLLNHMSSIHQDDPTIPCNYCTRLFSSKTTRDAHHKMIHQNQRRNLEYFKCPDCSLGFEMKEELRIHSFIHFEGEIHTCYECHQIFKKKKLLENHMNKHEKPTFQCKACKRMFKYRPNLGKHIKNGRCKGLIDNIIKTMTPQEEAEVAKEQLIKMTVNPTRVNLIGVSDICKTKSEKIDKNIAVKEENFEENISAVVIIKSEEIKQEKIVKQEKSSSKILEQSKKLDRSLINDYFCDLCDFSANKKCQMLSHIRHHISSRRHGCINCNERFATRMKLHNHSMKVHGRGVIGSVEYSKASAPCPECYQVFSAERLKFHMKLHEKPRHDCEICKKSFRSLSTLGKHLTNIHSDEKKFTCTTCGKGFRKLTILKHHEEIHNPIKIYVQCEICNTMMQMKSYKLHMEVKHGDRYKDKPHICECGKAFRYIKQLTKHYENVHKKVNRGVMYLCSEPGCELAFNRRIDLRNHSFDHFSGKIFECECGMKFKKRKLLTIHSAVHKGDTFPCNHCSLTFQTRGGRRKHQMKIHSRHVEEIF
ncbi:CLUMA_CG020648, isoform A [Clunio marinus]|uniref:CLUMA_CG020648, isoform A n=1 Tax=Clunio marinus TaxID=568069 RepID=A0A1J1J5K4_9DIPT|nr:CLUMA_CG020648, isoform A [Clunio marinus]